MNYNHRNNLQSKITLKTLFVLVLINSSGNLFSQNNKQKLVVSSLFRWDKYPQFSYASNNTSTNIVSIKGSSWGVNAAYKLPLKDIILLNVGLGDFRYSFNKINNINSRFGESDIRRINYVSSVGDPIFYTNKYWYNCIVLNIGVSKEISLGNNWQIEGGIQFSNYFTYSQYYRITSEYPTGPSKHRYTTTNSRYFGLSTSLIVELTKTFNRLSIGPSVIVPVYDIWKQDKVFPQDENNKSRNKWLGGIGLGISFGYQINNK